MNTVIFGANEGQIWINVDDGGYSQIDAAGILYAENDVTDALIDLGVNPSDDFYNATSVEFCDEEGFESGEADEIISKAIADLQKTLRKDSRI